MSEIERAKLQHEIDKKEKRIKYALDNVVITFNNPEYIFSSQKQEKSIAFIPKILKLWNQYYLIECSHILVSLRIRNWRQTQKT